MTWTALIGFEKFIHKLFVKLIMSDLYSGRGSQIKLICIQY